MKSLFTFLISTLVSLLIFELLLRAINLPPYPVGTIPNYYKSDDQIGFVLDPEWEGQHSDFEFDVDVKINSLGIRDYEHELNSTRKKILVVGDSFAFGHGVTVNKTFGGLLENYFKDFEFVKAGVESYSLIQSYLMMKRMVNLFHPHWVIFTLYEGNDYGDDTIIPFANRKVVGGYLVRKGSSETEAELNKNVKKHYSDKERRYYETKNRWLFNSRLYRFVRDKLIKLNLVKNPFIKKNKKGETICPVPIYTNYLNVKFPNSDESSKEQWAATKETLLKAKKFSLNNNFQLMVVIIPDKIQVDDNLVNYLTKNCNNWKDLLDPASFTQSNASTMLQKFLFENEIKNINLLPVFKKDKHLDQIYFKMDPHLTEYGSEVTFQAIKNFLNKENFMQTLSTK